MPSIWLYRVLKLKIHLKLQAVLCKYVSEFLDFKRETPSEWLKITYLSFV